MENTNQDVVPQDSFSQINAPEVNPEEKRTWTGPMVGIIIVALLVGGYFFWNSKSGSYQRVADNVAGFNLEMDTLEYSYPDSDFPYIVNYPKDYCWTQDIGAVVFHSDTSQCGLNNAINVPDDNILIFAFPTFAENVNNTQDYVRSDQFKGTKITDDRRNIGGYEAIRMEIVEGTEKDSTIWAFLSDYSDSLDDPEFAAQNPYDPGFLQYGVIIQSNLGTVENGDNIEELILSSFRFVESK